MSAAASKARERRYQRLIKALVETADALSSVIEHEGQILGTDDSRIRLRREVEEYGGYLAAASWWRAAK